MGGSVTAMNEPSLAPVFSSLRLVLNLIVVGLTSFVIVREALAGGVRGWSAVVLAILFLAIYGAGVRLRHRFEAGRHPVVVVWLAILTAGALALVWISPSAAYLVFPLFFLYLYLLPTRWGVVVVTAVTLMTITIFEIEGRLTAAGVIGPVVAAAVAVALGLGYRALYAESQERQRLIEELLSTRQELAEKEREAGMLGERSRLAREIHDTVAQGLSSIQLLLHAAERADGERPGIQHIRLARETAAANLEETRRFIRELTPQALDNETLVGALRRLAESTGSSTGAESPRVTFHISGDPAPLPMPIETALLRIAQGALANVMQHSGANHVTITLTYMEESVSLDIVDDGTGFDPDAARHGAVDRGGASFGLVAMRERVDSLGGALVIESTSGRGTALAVTFGRDR